MKNKGQLQTDGFGKVFVGSRGNFTGLQIIF